MKNLWVSVSGAIAQQRNVETIANNIANINTPGFKKDKLTFKEYMTVLDKGLQDIDLPRKEWTPEDFYRSYGAENSQVQIDGSFTIMDQGQLTPTNRPLDVGLQGKGLIEVLTNSGIRYTRRGTLSLNQQGNLVTDRGDLVLNDIPIPENANEKVDPITRAIKIPNGKISITRTGDIFTGETKVGKITIREFNDPHALKKEGGNYFINNDFNNIKKAPPTTSINQGFLEESNVNAISEMTELIKANRNFESIQRAIKAYDNIAGKSVNEIAKF